jgi:hypothetical protein
MRLANDLVFYIINWLFILVLILMIYRIRHIQDETLIKRECSRIVPIWTCASVI